MSTQLKAHRVEHGLRRELAKLAISAVIVAVGVGITVFLASLATPPPTKESTALIQQVQTYDAQPYSGLLTMEVSGSVVPHREIKVAAEVPGRIIKRHPACENGSFVSAGEPLLEIDPEAYDLELKTLEADLVQAEKRIEENHQQILGEEKNVKLAREDLEIQRRELDRIRKISSALSHSELEQSTRAFNAAQTQLTTRENNLATLRAAGQRLDAAKELSERQLEKAKLNLRRTVISAPADGVIVKALVQEGDFVNGGTQVVIFEDTSKAEIIVNLTPSELKWIRDNASVNAELIDTGARSVYRIPKTDVTVFDPIDPDISWKGVLNRFDGIGRDDITKTIPCRITVESPIVETELGSSALVRGMYVKCRMGIHVSSSVSNLISIPEVALHPDHSVWVVRDGNHVSQVAVEIINRVSLGSEENPRRYVVVKPLKGNLKTGDLIVVTPLSQPFAGMPVVLEGGG